MKAIGIDIGTTTISGVVFDPEAEKVLEARTIENGSFILAEHKWEKIQDPAVILEKSRHMLDDFLKLYPDTASIGITGQMHGILYTDPEGCPCSPLYTWQDGRGAAVADLIWETCGVKIPAGYGLATHVYNQRKGLVPDRAVNICTIGDCLGMYLTGRKRPLIHSSNAASLGFYDLKEACFNTDQLLSLGVRKDILPEITEDFSILGTYRGVLVTAALGDNQASFLGSVGLRNNILLLNMGTGGQISVLSDICFGAPGIEARPLVRGKYLLAGSSLCGGRAYAILERFLRSYTESAVGESSAQYKIMEKLAKDYENSNLFKDQMLVDTRFNGTRVDESLRGSISNLSEENFTPAGLIYGTLVGMSRELFDLYQIIFSGTGIHADKLIASGNGYRKNTVLQNISRKMFGAPLELAPYEEEAACGAAISSRFAG